MTLTEMLARIDIWIIDLQFDLTRESIREDPEGNERRLMELQLQQLLIAKANLEQVKRTHGGL